MPTFRTQKVVCNIKKDMASVLKKDCFLHEVEVLEEVHDTECPILTYGEVVEQDVSEAFIRMVNLYGDNPDTGENYAEAVYGRRGRDLVRVEELIHDPTEETVDPSEDEPVKVEKLPGAMDRDELKESLDELGVDYKGNTSNQKLRDLLVAAQMEAEAA